MRRNDGFVTFQTPNVHSLCSDVRPLTWQCILRCNAVETGNSPNFWASPSVSVITVRRPKEEKCWTATGCCIKWRHEQCLHFCLARSRSHVREEGCCKTNSESRTMYASRQRFGSCRQPKFCTVLRLNFTRMLEYCSDQWTIFRSLRNFSSLYSLELYYLLR